MKIIIKATGEKTTAQYITTKSGNKRYWVNGKTYTDKMFDKLFEKEGEDEILCWKSHLGNLFTEITTSNPSCAILSAPLKITYNIIAEAAQRALEINDPKLIAVFFRLAMYEESDPTSPKYDKEKTSAAIKAGGYK